MFWLLLLHVVGACVWVGGHLYLVLKIVPTAVQTQNTQPILGFESSFEKLGMTALATQIITGLWMARLLLPSWEMLLIDNLIATLIRFKLLWLVLTIITALSAQLWVIPHIKQAIDNAKFRKIFIAHIVIITLLALAFVVTGVMFRTGLPI